MAFTDVSVLLPVLVRIVEALEAANVIAKANCPDVSPPLLSSSSPAPTIGVIPEVQILTPGVEATRPVSSTLVSIPGELFDCSVRGEAVLAGLEVHFLVVLLVIVAHVLLRVVLHCLQLCLCVHVRVHYLHIRTPCSCHRLVL